MTGSLKCKSGFAVLPIPFAGVFAIALTCGLLSMPSGVVADGAGISGAKLQLTYKDERLSLEAENVPLRDLLEALGHESGFKLELRGDWGKLVSPSIVDLPLQQALVQILGAEGISYYLAFAPARDGASRRRVSKLTVFPGPSGQGSARGSGPVRRKPAERPVEPIEPASGKGEREAIEILEQLLLDSEDPEIREATLEALRDIEAVAADL